MVISYHLARQLVRGLSFMVHLGYMAAPSDHAPQRAPMSTSFLSLAKTFLAAYADRMAGSEQLKAWLTREGRKAKWLAARIGVPEARMSKWVNGHARPMLEHRLSIEAETGVPVDSWV